MTAHDYVLLADSARLRRAAAEGDVRSMRALAANLNLAAISIRIIDNMSSG